MENPGDDTFVSAISSWRQKVLPGVSYVGTVQLPLDPPSVNPGHLWSVQLLRTGGCHSQINSYVEIEQTYQEHVSNIIELGIHP